MSMLPRRLRVCLSWHLAHVGQAHAVPVAVDEAADTGRHDEEPQAFRLDSRRPVPRLALDEHDVGAADADDVPGPERGSRAGAGVAASL